MNGASVLPLKADQLWFSNRMTNTVWTGGRFPAWAAAAKISTVKTGSK